MPLSWLGLTTLSQLLIFTALYNATSHCCFLKSGTILSLQLSTKPLEKTCCQIKLAGITQRMSRDPWMLCSKTNNFWSIFHETYRAHQESVLKYRLFKQHGKKEKKEYLELAVRWVSCWRLCRASCVSSPLQSEIWRATDHLESEGAHRGLPQISPVASLPQRGERRWALCRGSPPRSIHPPSRCNPSLPAPPVPHNMEYPRFLALILALHTFMSQI